MATPRAAECVGHGTTACYGIRVVEVGSTLLHSGIDRLQIRRGIAVRAHYSNFVGVTLEDFVTMYSGMDRGAVVGV